MKKVFKTLSAILLATACLVPGLAWAAGPSVTLDANGVLKTSDLGDTHSILVEIAITGENADKVTDVELMNAPSDILASAVYANGKATIAASAGDNVLKLPNSTLGTLDIIAMDASEANPVRVNAHITSIEYLDSADSTAQTKTMSVDSSDATLTSTRGESTGGSGGGVDQGAGLGSGIDGGARANDTNGMNGTNGNGGATSTADYKANGVVSSTQAGQSTSGNTGLVKTGDVLAICGIALGAAAIGVVVVMLVSRKKGAARK